VRTSNLAPTNLPSPPHDEPDVSIGELLRNQAPCLEMAMNACLNRYSKVLTCCFASCLLIAGCLISQAHGQTFFPGCESPRTLVARSANVPPVGDLKLTAYRLEESTAGVFCLSVTVDGPGHFLIWIGDDPRLGLKVRAGEFQFMASFRPEWLQDGASISVSRSEAPYELTTHPERLKLPESLRRRLADAPRDRQQIMSIRSVSRDVAGTLRRFVVVVITGPTFCTNSMNDTCVIQIGQKEYWGWADGTLRCEMTEEEFAALEDGAPVRVNWGFRALHSGGAGKSFARLDKSMLVDGK
jgi:hypothetical protein